METDLSRLLSEGCPFRARRLTRRERRNIKRPDKAPADPAREEAILDIIATAELQDHRKTADRDRGLNDPVCRQIRPDTKLTRPDPRGPFSPRFTKRSDFIDARKLDAPAPQVKAIPEPKPQLESYRDETI